jgi:chloride channel protein, CIC family
MIGVVAGLGAILFQLLGQTVIHFTLSGLAGFAPQEAAGEHAIFSHRETEFSMVGLMVVITAGGLASGFLVYTFAPEAEGHGTDAAIDSFHNKRGMVRGRVPIVKTLASAITIGTGGSGGREGPIAQIGAGFGSFLATRLNLSARDRRIMLAAGMGAGVGAIFRAPLAGALFAGEILYREADLESEVIVPAAISSIVGYSVYALSLPADKRFTPLFGDQLKYALGSPLELVSYAVLACVLVLVGVLYIKTFYGTHKLFKKLPILPHFRPAVGAGLAGLCGIGFYLAMGRDPHALAVLSTGYGALQEALAPGGDLVAIRLLLLIALIKIVTTSLTISSGGSGGVFGPSMVIGGCLGAAVGQFFFQTFHERYPGWIAQPGAYAIVGMAGFFAGCAHAPFSTIIMVSEMTGDYHLLLPTMWVSMLCFLMSKRWSLYEKQVPTRLESPAHRGDFIVDVLEGLRVADAYRKDRKLIHIPESMSLDGIVHTLAKTNQHYFPVVDEAGKMVGIFSADDVRSWLYDDSIWTLAVARDVMVTKIVSVTPEDDLNTALQRFTALNLDELPVLDPEDQGKLLGMLRRKETIAVYNQSLMKHKQAME